MVLVLFAKLSHKVDVCCEHSHLLATGFNFSEFGVVVNNNFDNTIFLYWNFLISKDSFAFVDVLIFLLVIGGCPFKGAGTVVFSGFNSLN